MNIKKFLKQDEPYTVKFPMLCFPIFQTNGKLHAEKIGVLNMEGVEKIKNESDFHSWARDPITGVINVTIDSEGLKKAVSQWIGGQKSMYEEWRLENEAMMRG